MGDDVMRRHVVVTHRAAADWIAERAPKTAEKWFAESAAKLQTLAINPERCTRARESRKMPFELRELLFGRRRQWRVLFTVRQDIVLVMAIRHAAQDDVTLEELMG